MLPAVIFYNMSGSMVLILKSHFLVFYDLLHAVLKALSLEKIVHRVVLLNGKILLLIGAFFYFIVHKVVPLNVK